MSQAKSADAPLPPAAAAAVLLARCAPPFLVFALPDSFVFGSLFSSGCQARLRLLPDSGRSRQQAEPDRREAPGQAAIRGGRAAHWQAQGAVGRQGPGRPAETEEAGRATEGEHSNVPSASVRTPPHARPTGTTTTTSSGSRPLARTVCSISVCGLSFCLCLQDRSSTRSQEASRRSKSLPRRAFRQTNKFSSQFRIARAARMQSQAAQIGCGYVGQCGLWHDKELYAVVGREQFVWKNSGAQRTRVETI